MHPGPSSEPSGKLTAASVAVFSGIEARILLGGEQAPMTVMAMQVAPAQGAPAHISPAEDKLFHVASGALSFLIGEDRVRVSAGDHLFVARGMIHGFVAVGEEAAHLTLVSTPARHDRFFLAMSALPTPHDVAQVEEICRRFEQVIVGPVPSA